MRLVIMSALLLASAPALALDDPTAAEAKQQKEKKVCRRDVSSASRMAKRVCKTVGEWQALAEDDGAKLGVLGADANARQHTSPISGAPR